MSQNLPVEIDVEPVEIEELVALEEQSKVMKRMMALALEHTTDHDWVLMRGKVEPIPYLQASGVEKIAKLFGVSWIDVKREKAAKGDEGHYSWRYEATFIQRKRNVRAFGSRASDDPFFTTYYDRGEKRQRAAREIDEGNVELAAYTNMVCNGVKRILGLRGMTIDQLKRAGLHPERMQGVEYKESGASARAKQREEVGEAAEKAADTTQKESWAKQLADLVVQIAGPDPEAQKDFLEQATAFTNKETGETVSGVRSFKGLSDKRAMVTFKRVKHDLEEGKYQPATTDASREPGEDG